MNKHGVKIVTREQLKQAGISLDVFPSAGPRANITGMRNKYWGKDAYILKVGTYIYKVNAEIYSKF